MTESTDRPPQLGGYYTGPDQDDIDALRRWALDPANRRNHPDAAKRIHRVCNGVSTLRAEIMGLKNKLNRLKTALARAKGRKPLEE